MEPEQKPLPSGFSAKSTAEEVAKGISLQGKVIVVTGGHAGLGLETTRVLSLAGATVVVGARDPQKGAEAVAGMQNVKVLQLDLADPASIDQFAAQFLALHPSLDILINNAGVMQTPLMRDARGYELQFATNHLGHFQLTVRLWDALKKSGNARVITLSSYGHRFAGVDLEDPHFKVRPYDKKVAYGNSKTANSLFSVELDQRGKPHGIRAFAVHPGGILTDLVRHLSDDDLKPWGIVRENGVLKSPPTLKTVPEGAATTVWAATSPQLNGLGGVYCADCDISPLAEGDQPSAAAVLKWAVDKPTAKALWALTVELTGCNLPAD